MQLTKVNLANTKFLFILFKIFYYYQLFKEESFSLYAELKGGALFFTLLLTDKKACSNNIQSAPSGVTDMGDPPKVNGSHEVVVKESGAEAATTKADCGFPER